MTETFQLVISEEPHADTDFDGCRQYLAGLPGLDASAVEAWCNRDTAPRGETGELVLDHLSFLMAHDHRRRLAGLGIIGRVRPMRTCPVCTLRQQRGDRCLRCDHAFSSTGLRNMPEPSSLESDSRPGNPRLERHKQRAMSMITIGAALLAAVFFLDPLLHLLMWDFPWLYVIPLPPFVFGCRHIARLKGHSGWWGLTGLTVLPGIAVSLLLPDRRSPEARQDLFVRDNLVALVMIGVFFFWAWQHLDTWRKWREIDAAGERLELAARSVSPLYPLNYQIMALGSYLDRCFAFAADQDLRPREKYRVAWAIFERVDRFLVHLRYQRFAHYRATGKNMASTHDEAAIQRLRQEFTEYFRRKMVELDDVYFTTCAYWSFMESHYRPRIFSQKLRSAIRGVNILEERLTNAVAGFVRDRGVLPSSLAELAEAEARWFQERADISFGGNGIVTVTLRNTVSDLNGETIEYGMMIPLPGSKADPVEGKWMLRVGGTLPDKYRVDIQWVTFRDAPAGRDPGPWELLQ